MCTGCADSSAASVRRASISLVRSADTRPRAGVAAALRRAVDARLLVTGADGELRWRHALTQDAVLATARRGRVGRARGPRRLEMTRYATEVVTTSLRTAEQMFDV